MAPHPPLMRVVIAAVIQHIELEFCPLTQAKLLCFAFALCMAFVWIASEFIDGHKITTARLKRSAASRDGTGPDKADDGIGPVLGQAVVILRPSMNSDIIQTNAIQSANAKHKSFA
jgi:hypothetical protein